MFTIRDHDQETTPLQAFKDQITRDVENIWKDLKKPEEFQDCSYTDLFELKFFSLPHKVYQKEKFLEAIDVLRSNFSGTGPDNYFLTPYHQKKSVPAESLGNYTSRLWNSIVTHKDLNIPSEKKMLAMFRCDEILHSCIKDAAPEIASLRSKVQANYHPEFKKNATNILQSTIDSFTHQAIGYDADMVMRKKEETTSRIFEELQIVYIEQLGHIRTQVISNLRELMISLFPRDKISTSFEEECSSAIHTAENKFVTLAQESMIENSNWSYDSVKEDFLKSVVDLKDSFRTAQLDGLSDLVKLKSKESLSSLSVKFSSSSPGLWKEVSSIVHGTVNQLLNEVRDRLKKSFDSSNEEINRFEKLIVEVVYMHVLDDAKREALYVKRKMHNSFDRSFKLAADGISPRKWSSSDNIRHTFENSIKKVNSSLLHFFYNFPVC